MRHDARVPLRRLGVSWGTMNKAFVRDPEPQDPCCPERKGCGSVGVPVEAATLRAQLSEEALRELQGDAFYCPNPACDVAYFDAWGATVALEHLAKPAYPKPPSAPLCHCLGVTAEEIVDEAQRGCRDRIRRLVAEAESGAQHCARRMPSGRPCTTEARRLFMANFKSA